MTPDQFPVENNLTKNFSANIQTKPENQELIRVFKRKEMTRGSLKNGNTLTNLLAYESS